MGLRYKQSKKRCGAIGPKTPIGDVLWYFYFVRVVLANTVNYWFLLKEVVCFFAHKIMDVHWMPVKHWKHQSPLDMISTPILVQDGNVYSKTGKGFEPRSHIISR